MMNYINKAFGWMWQNKKFFGAVSVSALLFFIWLFPFSDLSQLLTTTIARATGNSVYLEVESMDFHIVPQPSISATGITLETTLPPLQATWAKITPSLLSILMNLGALTKAQSDPVAAQAAMTKMGLSVSAEGLLGADVSFSVGPGKKYEGKDRSRVQLAFENLNLKQMQEWSGLPIKMEGRANLSTDMLIMPDMTEQPDGDFTVQISKFNLPASTISIPMGEASMPLNVPTLTLANVVLKGRMAGGNLVIEDGTFGANQDPIHGRIKGTIGLRLERRGDQIVPSMDSYNLKLDLNTSKAVEKEIGFAFLLFDKAKTPTPTGSRYIFRMDGRGPGAPPNITKETQF